MGVIGFQVFHCWFATWQAQCSGHSAKWSTFSCQHLATSKNPSPSHPFFFPHTETVLLFFWVLEIHFLPLPSSPKRAWTGQSTSDQPLPNNGCLDKVLFFIFFFPFSELCSHSWGLFGQDKSSSWCFLKTPDYIFKLAGYIISKPSFFLVVYFQITSSCYGGVFIPKYELRIISIYLVTYR